MTSIACFLSILLTFSMLQDQDVDIFLEINGNRQISDKYYEMPAGELKTLRPHSHLNIAQVEYTLMIQENRLSKYYDTRNWRKKIDFKVMKWEFKANNRLLVVITDKSGKAYIREIRFK